ncbi:hypothetical protein QYF36_003984 [Acer negundo]|nr:hypothetical protein QYF36_003984 [Acer negundo]
MFGASPLSPSPETANDGNPIIKKRHRHRLSIQSVFPGLPNTLFIRKKPPAIEIEKRSKRRPLNLRLELRKRARPRRGGLSGTGEDGWIRIIELGADRRFVHWDWAWTSLDWASIDEKMTKSKRLPSRFINRCRMKDQVQDSSQIDLPSHLRGFRIKAKHGHLQLRGSSRSSIEEPGRVNSKVPYSGCKAEEEGEWAQPHQQPAFSTRKELKIKQESVFTIYRVE